MHAEKRSEPRLVVSGVCWMVRSEGEQVGTAALLENISTGGACMRLHHESPRADRILKEAISGPLLLEVPIVPLHGQRKALVRWTGLGKDGMRRFGLEWIERLEAFPSLVRGLGREHEPNLAPNPSSPPT